MNEIGAYQRQQGLSDEELSALISEKLGRNISVRGVQTILKRKSAPIPWMNALGISPQEPTGMTNGDKESSPPKSSVKSAPSPAPTIPLPFEVTSARASIEFIYAMAGRGVAMGTKVPDVAKTWESQAPQLAEAWIKWAETNKTVANGIAMLTVGGPGGQVILMNATLIVSTLMTISQARNISLIPPGFQPPHERPQEDENLIRENTDAAVDHALRFPSQD